MILSIIDGILGFVFTIGTLIVIFGGFQWIMAKFFGTHFHGKFQARNALNEQHQYESLVQEYLRKNPSIVDKAIERCKKKGFSRTHYNILSEIRKIEKEKSGQPNLSKKVTQTINKVSDKVIGDKTKSEIEKLERLNKLKNEGGLTEKEFDNYKNRILHKDVKKRKIEEEIHNENTNVDQYDFSKNQQMREIQKAMKTINSLYFEFQGEVDFLDSMDLQDVHETILEKRETIAIINSYDNLFELYSNDLINNDEFKLKKKQILIKSLKPN